MKSTNPSIGRRSRSPRPAAEQANAVVCLLHGRLRHPGSSPPGIHKNNLCPRTNIIFFVKKSRGMMRNGNGESGIVVRGKKCFGHRASEKNGGRSSGIGVRKIDNRPSSIGNDLGHLEKTRIGIRGSGKTGIVPRASCIGHQKKGRSGSGDRDSGFGVWQLAPAGCVIQ